MEERNTAIPSICKIICYNEKTVCHKTLTGNGEMRRRSNDNGTDAKDQEKMLKDGSVLKYMYTVAGAGKGLLRQGLCCCLPGSCWQL